MRISVWTAVIVALAVGPVGGVSAQPPGNQFPAYIQLHRDVLINADLWSDRPEILAANYGFEGIIGIPGLMTAQDLPLAVNAGAGVNLDWAGLDPVPSLRNLTSGAGPLGVLAAGFGASPVFGDALPIEVSWPILPSSVSPEKIEITLNTGEVVTPVAAALNPNYDHNERHVIVVFGEFGNRLKPGTADAIYPVAVTFVDGPSPLMAVGPNGPVSLGGLTQISTNPYVAGPALVGAKLSPASPVGDFAPPVLSGASPNDGFSLYGEDAQFRLRLYTTGGFSPDGVSGILPTDFSKLFRLHAVDADGNPVVISEEGRVYDLGVGTVEVIGLAEVGPPSDRDADRAYAADDHDNYFDIILKGDEEAIRLLRSVEIPTSAEPGYSDIYNPGGPGRTPDANTVYTEPARPQVIDIFLSLDSPRTVSYAAQDLASYDRDDDLPVVFRLSRPDSPDILTSSSNEAADLIDSGYVLKAVEFANETARPGVSDVNAWFEPATGDRLYTLDAAEQSALSAGGTWENEGRAFGAFDRAWPGAAPIYRFYDTTTGWHQFTPDLNGPLQQNGIDYEGIGWFAAVFTPRPTVIRFDRTDHVRLTDPIVSSGSLLKEGTGVLILAKGGDFTEGITVRSGRLQVDGLLSGGPLIVEPGGTLSGNGLIANETGVQGRLSPGQSPGTMTFLAPVTMAAGGVLEIEIDGPTPTPGAGGYDRVLVLGPQGRFTADGTLTVRLRDITPPATNSFTPVLGQVFPGVVMAEGGVAGSFTALEQPHAGLPAGSRIDTLYNPLSIDLVVTPEQYGNLATAGLVQNANQKAVGRTLDAIRPAAGVRPTGAAAELFPALAPLSSDQITRALDSLAGQVHADVLESASLGQQLIVSAFRVRFMELSTGVSGVDESTSAWMKLLGSDGNRQSANGIAGFDSQHHGVMIGVERRPLTSLQLGFAAGALESAVSAGDGSAEVTSTFASLYGVSHFDSFRLGGHLLGSVDDYDSLRYVRIGDFSSNPRGSTNGWGLAAGAFLDGLLPLGGPFTLEPMLGLALGSVERDRLLETGGGSAALHILDSHRSSLQSRLGTALRYREAGWLANLSLGWNHEFLDERATHSAELAGSPFLIQTAAPGRNFLDLDAGIGLWRNSGLSLTAHYLLLASRGATVHGGVANLQYTW